MNTNIPSAHGVIVQQDKNDICATWTAALSGLQHTTSKWIHLESSERARHLCVLLHAVNSQALRITFHSYFNMWFKWGVMQRDSHKPRNWWTHFVSLQTYKVCNAASYYCCSCPSFSSCYNLYNQILLCYGHASNPFYNRRNLKDNSDHSLVITSPACLVALDPPKKTPCWRKLNSFKHKKIQEDLTIHSKKR